MLLLPLDLHYGMYEGNGLRFVRMDVREGSGVMANAGMWSA